MRCEVVVVVVDGKTCISYPSLFHCVVFSCSCSTMECIHLTKLQHTMIYKRIPNEENLGSSLVVLLFDLVWKMGFDNVTSIPMNSCHLGTSISYISYELCENVVS